MRIPEVGRNLEQYEELQYDTHVILLGRQAESMKKVLLMGLALVLALSLAGCTINILPAATLQGSVEFEGGDPAVNPK